MIVIVGSFKVGRLTNIKPVTIYMMATGVKSLFSNRFKKRRHIKKLIMWNKLHD